MPLLSGRGLGHTGGTLDKLESIPGFRSDLTLDEFRRGVEKIGCVITGQTENLAPADRLMYALRDVTATVESIPLICGSILSKKFAAGPRGLVFDVKCGNGAFMKDIDSAKNLANNLIRIGKLMGRNVSALITDMNQPLGSAVGNLLEVMECIDFLKGSWQDDLYEVTMGLSAEMLMLAGVETNRQQAIKLLNSKLEDGSALGKFQEMVEYQRGDLSGLLEAEKAPGARYVVWHKARQDGYLQAYSTFEIGRTVIELGGGRVAREDVIDPAVGFKFLKKISDEVSAGEIIAEIHANDRSRANDIDKKLYRHIKIGENRPVVPELIKEHLG